MSDSKFPPTDAEVLAAGDCAAGPGDVRLVLITAPDETEARRLAGGLVEARLAACVNLLPGARSVYRYGGQVHDEGECLMIVKSTRARWRDLEDWVDRNHPYDCPECIAIEPRGVMAGYLAWWLGETGA